MRWLGIVSASTGYHTLWGRLRRCPHTICRFVLIPEIEIQPRVSHLSGSNKRASHLRVTGLDEPLRTVLESTSQPVRMLNPKRKFR